MPASCVALTIVVMTTINASDARIALSPHAAGFLVSACVFLALALALGLLAVTGDVGPGSPGVDGPMSSLDYLSQHHQGLPAGGPSPGPLG